VADLSALWERLHREYATDRQRPPREGTPPRGSVLVLAPHPDDETFGLGGTLALHARQGDRVEVLYLTDGGHGDPDGHWSRAELVALRQQEAQAAVAILGGQVAGFWEYPDSYPTVSQEALDDLSGRLAAFVDDRAPATVYFPWPGESHQDHWAAGIATVRAARRLRGARPRLRAYEVWSPFLADEVIDVSGVYDVKLRAAAAYQSQLRYKDYFPIIQGLNAYRALFLRGGGKYAEAFLETGAP